jgi:tetratricopeptide (TPR) repeat protein
VARYQKTVFTSFLVFLPAGVAAVIWFQLTRTSSSAVVVAGAITILVIALAINQAALVVPLRRRFTTAVERQDADGVDAVLDEAAAMWPRSAKMRAFVDGNRGVALMFRERWVEAVAQARSALARPLARTQEALLLNNLAWALAHTGALDEAATIGERALSGAQTEVLRGFANGTLGAIYALRGEADRALVHLDAADAISAGGGAIQATRQYYRGVVFQSKGLAADAIGAFEAARAAAPASPFGRHAASRLADLRSPRRSPSYPLGRAQSP